MTPCCLVQIYMFHYCFHLQVGRRWQYVYVKFWQISTIQHGITAQAEVIVMTTVRNSYIIKGNKILDTWRNLWSNKLPRLSLLYTRHGTMRSWRIYEQLRMSFRCRFAQHETEHILSGVVYSIWQQCTMHDKQKMIWTCQWPTFKIISLCLFPGAEEGTYQCFQQWAICSKIHTWGQHKCFIHNNGDTW